MVPNPEIVTIIEKEFFEAGACDVKELDFGFLRGAGGLAALHNVLFPGPSCLDHLVDRAVVTGEELVTEVECEVIHNFALPVGEQVLVVAMRRNKAIRGVDQECS